ncbi:50S ribosomal protein L32 [bacterium]|nr:50S ribosomal protein L32 [bacterium]
MAVPKKRTSKATKGQRRSHHAATPAQLMTEPESGLVVPRRLWRAAKEGLARIGSKR